MGGRPRFPQLPQFSFSKMESLESMERFTSCIHARARMGRWVYYSAWGISATVL